MNKEPEAIPAHADHCCAAHKDIVSHNSCGSWCIYCAPCCAPQTGALNVSFAPAAQPAKTDDVLAREAQEIVRAWLLTSNPHHLVETTETHEFLMRSRGRFCPRHGTVEASHRCRDYDGPDSRHRVAPSPLPPAFHVCEGDIEYIRSSLAGEAGRVGIVSASLAWMEAWGLIWEGDESDTARDNLNNVSKALYDAVCDYKRKKGE